MKGKDRTHLGVLGIFAEQDATHQEMRDRLQHNFGRYVTAGYGALKPAISDLREDQLIKYTDGRYSIEQKGRTYLRTLLRESIEDVRDPTQKPHLFMKLGFLHHLSEKEQEDELATLEDQFQQARDKWVAIHDQHKQAISSSQGYRREILDLDIRTFDVYLNWVKNIREDRNTR